MKRLNPPFDVDRQVEGTARSEDKQGRIEQTWNRAYAAQTPEDLLGLYADWAENYDEDHEQVGFFGHIRTSEVLAKYTPAPEAAILDAGAGTGSAGTALAQRGYRNLTAVDLSPEMLEQAAQKGVYKRTLQVDLSYPLDEFQANSFDAAILVGVFSYGQAPASALDEVIRVVKPGGVIAFTMRTDFFESDAMSVRSRMEQLENDNVWELVELTEPELYLPRKDPTARFRVWCYRVLEKPVIALDDPFTVATQQAFSSPAPVKRLDHRYIWNCRASRLYDRYIESQPYYLNVCEEEIIQRNAHEIVGEEPLIVELGCGSARKVRHLLEMAIKKREANPGRDLTYIPIDLSPGAVQATREQVEELFGDRIQVSTRHACFSEALPTVSTTKNKLMLFFGSSIGNLETIEATVDVLRMIRENMRSGDRFVVGMDLHKDERILRDAYQSGRINLAFFLNIVRRMNDELGANFDLKAFYQDSSFDQGPSYHGVENWCVNFKLVTSQTQQVHFQRMGMDAVLKEGEAIQVGVSRKFRKEHIGQLASLAGLRLRRQWLDSRKYFSLNEFVLASPAPGAVEGKPQ